MGIPFTSEQFLDVFRDYNEAIWPAQIIAYVLGAIAIVNAAMKSAADEKLVPAILTLFWVWIGAIYHMIYFVPINPAAWLFGGLFFLQGALFFFAGVVKTRLKFRFRADLYGITGAFFLIYATILYPLIGYALGHEYPAAPTFGVTPCPAVIFTFGLLLWTSRPVPKILIVIPLVWSAIGLSAALSLGMLEDIMMTIAGIVATVLLVYRDRKVKLESIAT